ncbi:hypothetical protein QR685DRAFT_512756 [Neurospora intermedia]|uniref:Uncharacterized protein n=1 Tax=Neurospora intermedia TaxID=5142 RepID=A0ABR3DRZ5_NEUIN
MNRRLGGLAFQIIVLLHPGIFFLYCRLRDTLTQVWLELVIGFGWVNQGFFHYHHTIII